MKFVAPVDPNSSLFIRHSPWHMAILRERTHEWETWCGMTFSDLDRIKVLEISPALGKHCDTCIDAYRDYSSEGNDQ